MYLPFIVAIILSFCIHDVLNINCPESPGKWCETKEIAEACGV